MFKKVLKNRADTLPRSASEGSNWLGLSHSSRKAVQHIEKPQEAQDEGKDGSKNIMCVLLSHSVMFSLILYCKYENHIK